MLLIVLLVFSSFNLLDPLFLVKWEYTETQQANNVFKQLQMQIEMQIT